MTTSLIGLGPLDLQATLIDSGVVAKKADAGMRRDQLWNWIYVRGRRDFGQMTNLSKEVRARLAEKFSLDRPEVVSEQVSTDGTRKWLLRTGPGIEFETVYIPEPDR